LSVILGIFDFLFYHRYVDDILIVVTLNAINNFRQIYFEIHPKMQLTLEVRGNKINFLRGN